MKSLFDPAIAALARKAADNATVNSSDYFGDDGLLYCGNCRTPKQCIIEMFGAPSVVHCDCVCLAEKHRSEHEAETLRQKILFCRSEVFDNPTMLTWDLFEIDDGEEPGVSEAIRKYIDNFDKFAVDGRGLLFWSQTTGNGKTVCAATIANHLVNKGVSCRMEEMGMILKNLQGVYKNNQADYISHLCKFDLLVIDDLGTERRTEWANETVYDIINERYKARKPTIFTTNLSIEQLKAPQNTHEQRIFERVLKMAHPIPIKHTSRRLRESAAQFIAEREILGM